MLDELNILARLLPSLPRNAGVVIGPGDDCAALAWTGGRVLLAAVDQVVGDVHYYRGATPPEAAGRKLMCRNLSDIAAMGGVPRWALLAVAAGGRDAEWVLAFCRGVADAGARYGVAVVGGDLAGFPGEGEVAALTILGEAEEARLLLRSGANPGDALYVTGELGNSLASGRHLDFEPRLKEGKFLADNGFASAMLDVSDGLLLDAKRLAEASRLRLRIDPAALPLRAGATAEGALSDGEDYELLFTVPSGKEAELVRNWNLTTRLTRIGVAESGEPDVCDPAGRSLLTRGKCGYEH